MLQGSYFDRVIEVRYHFTCLALCAKHKCAAQSTSKNRAIAEIMKFLKLTALMFVFLILGCNQTNRRTTLTIVQKSSTELDNKEELQELVRKLYEWRETKNSRLDFDPVADKEGRYIELDLKEHEQRLTELKQSGFFADQFLENYHKIALMIDNGLKTKTIEYLVGDLPPYGNGADPWCNCQDYPDKYWQTMIVDKIQLDNTNATFIWTWVDPTLGDRSFEYKVDAIKENDRWLITYLQGFDFNEFFPTK